MSCPKDREDNAPNSAHSLGRCCGQKGSQIKVTSIEL